MIARFTGGVLSRAYIIVAALLIAPPQAAMAQDSGHESGAANGASHTAANPNPQDCREGMTEYDQKILADLESKLSSIKDSSPTNIENRAKQLIEENFDSLSPMAKAFFVQMSIKLRSDVQSKSKSLRIALDTYMSNSEFHSRTFGPGGTYSSMGTMDIVIGKSDRIFSDSLKKVASSESDLNREILKEYNAGHLSAEAKSKLLEAIRENNKLLSDRQNLMLDSTIERLKSSQKTIVLTAGAAIATVATLGAASGTFAAVLCPTATAAVVGGGSGVAGTIFVGQGKMLAEAAASGGDISCQFALKAIQGNDKLAHDAIQNGLIGAVLGGGVGKLLSVGGKFAANTLTGLKGLSSIGIGVGAFGTGANATKAMNSYSTARDLAAKSDEAFNAKDYAQAKKYQDQSEAALSEAKHYSIEAGSSAATAAIGAISLRSIGRLSKSFKPADEKLARGSIDEDFPELSSTARQGIKDAHTRVPTGKGTVKGEQLTRSDLREKVKIMKSAGVVNRATRRRAIEGGYAGFEDSKTRNLTEASLKRIIDADDPVVRTHKKYLGTVKEEIRNFKTSVNEELQAVQSERGLSAPGWDDFQGASTTAKTAKNGVEITTGSARAKAFGLEEYPSKISANPSGKNDVRIDIEINGRSESITVPQSEVHLSSDPKVLSRNVVSAVAKHFKDEQNALKQVRVKNLERLKAELETIDPDDSLSFAEKLRKIMDLMKIDDI